MEIEFGKRRENVQIVQIYIEMQGVRKGRFHIRKMDFLTNYVRATG